MITYLGGLLGGIIGAIQALFVILFKKKWFVINERSSIVCYSGVVCQMAMMKGAIYNGC